VHAYQQMFFYFLKRVYGKYPIDGNTIAEYAWHGLDQHNFLVNLIFVTSMSQNIFVLEASSSLHHLASCEINNRRQLSSSLPEKPHR